VTERELEQRAKHKLAVLNHVQEVSGSVAATCRYYGISQNCYYYKWLKRYEDEGFEGLTDRSSAPHRSPMATRADVVEKVLWFAPALPLRAGEDRDVPAPVPPGDDQPVWSLAHPAPGWVSGLPTSQRYKRRETRWKRYEKQRQATSGRPTSSSSSRWVARPQAALLPVHRDR
jgi:hypothetical protein